MNNLIFILDRRDSLTLHVISFNLGAGRSTPSALELRILKFGFYNKEL